MKTVVGFLLCMSCTLGFAADNAYFGDLHVHTRYSFDAFLFGTKTSPDDAYRFAKGEAIPHGGGFDIQLDRPLDFYAVTDHAFYLGMWWAMTEPAHPLNQNPDARRYLDAKTPDERRAAFQGAGAFLSRNVNETDIRTAWQDIQGAAARHNDPGKFTTFIGYEYTSARNGNLHRNVIFATDKAPELPFSRLDSLNPEDLWDWMDEARANGAEALAIPHNANGSNGNMFDLVKFAGGPLDTEYAEQRMRNEPLVEITQIKGTSDTHPFLSPNDEWSDFEIFPYQIARWDKSRPQGSYVREAWLNGLTMTARDGFNPYRFGIIGASDTHNSGERFDESKFVSKVGAVDSNPVYRGSIPVSEEPGAGYREVYNRFFGASGLAGVWADANTRDSIYAAFRRMETFATTGPRMKVKLSGGYDDEEVPQGGTLAAGKASPTLRAWAVADPLGTKLQRLQIIKGWYADGGAHEEVYDVACADGGRVNPATNRCPESDASVDLSNCAYSDHGAGELASEWRDPNFDPGQHAFYYVRALENPTCRWSTWDALRGGFAPRPDLPTTIQERAWTSPIWIEPR